MPQEPRLPFPFGGLDDDLSFGDQKAGTTRDALNVRGLDPVTGRLRGAQRSGLTKYTTTDPVTDALIDAGGVKVSEINSVVLDDANITYAKLGTASIEAATREFEATLAPAPNSNVVLNVQTDRQNNSYWIDADNVIVKLNPDGVEIARITLPVPDPLMRVWSIHVDDFDCVYAATSSGVRAPSGTTFAGPTSADQSKARIWKYIPDEDNEYTLFWTLEPGQYVMDMKVRGENLYTVQNSPDTYQSELVVYNNITGSIPGVIIRRPIPYPTVSLDLNTDGAIFIGWPKFADRGNAPLNPAGFSPKSEAWTITDLQNYAERIWASHNANTITGIDAGDPITAWLDQSGYRRDYQLNTNIAGQSFPTYNPNGLNGEPTLSFEDNDTSLMSAANSQTTNEASDTQLTTVPQYDEGMYAAFFVLRPVFEASNRAAAFGHEVQSGFVKEAILWVNAEPTGSGTADASFPTQTAGAIWFSDPTDSADEGNSGVSSPSTGDYPAGSTFDNTNRVAIVGILRDNGRDSGASTSKTRSLFCVNGTNVDRYQSSSEAGLTDNVEVSGTSFQTSGGGNQWQYNGEIAAIYVLRDKGSSSTSSPFTEDKVLSHPKYPDVVYDSTSDTEWERIFGWLHHRYGCQHLLESQEGFSISGATWTSGTLTLTSTGSFTNYTWREGHTINITGGTGATTGIYRIASKVDSDNITLATSIGANNVDTAGDVQTYPHPYADIAPTGEDVTELKKLSDPSAGVAKFDAQGRLVWVANGGTDSLNGIGYGIAVNSDGNVYTCGQYDDYSGSESFRMLVDDGDDFSTSGDAWTASPANTGLDDATYPVMRLAVDEFDNVFIPWADSGVAEVALWVYDKDGTQFHDLQVDVSPNERKAVAVALPRQAPDFGTQGTNLAEFAFLATEATAIGLSTTIANAHKIKFISSTPATGSTRSTIYIAVSDGDIRKYTDTAVTTPTNGGSALDSTSQYVQSVAALQKLYFSDGVQYKVYDPATDAVSDFVAADGGQIPQRCKLIEWWRDRLVLARPADDPHIWYVSQLGDPTKWDIYPPVPSSDQSTAGTIARAGGIPDIVNGFISVSDDWAIVGGDKSVWRFSGDPMDGGQVDLISNITGMAFGRAWTQGPDGEAYFFGSRGDVYVVNPSGTAITRITRDSIRRRLQSVDLSSVYIRMAWNYRDEGLHVFQFPYGAGGTTRKHWFWEQKTGAWWEDEFGVQPSAVFVQDGDDPNDRVLVLGGEDSYVRKWDEAAKGDDGQPIRSHVLMGPMVGSEEDYEYGFSPFTFVLADNQEGATVKLYATDEPDVLGDPKRIYEVGPGRNLPVRQRMRGSYCFAWIGNQLLNQRFALEKAHVGVEMLGPQRLRSS